MFLCHLIHVAFLQKSREDPGDPLAFVNRYTETVDVLIPNLDNQRAIVQHESVYKPLSPLAVQPPGTGKTLLGLNLSNVLNRPREDAKVEAFVASRLKDAWSSKRMIGFQTALDEALHDPREENLVMRLLLVLYPDLQQMLLDLKTVTPLLVKMNNLEYPPLAPNFATALGAAIFSAARPEFADYSFKELIDAYSKFTIHALTPVGVVKTLKRNNNNKPVMLVLDGIQDLQTTDYSPFFKNINRDLPLHRAMLGLSAELQLLHMIPGCFVLSTGHSLWPAINALHGVGSPLFGAPVLLYPMNAKDLEESLMLTYGVSDSSSLARELGVSIESLSYFLERVIAVTGGLGCAVQFLVRYWHIADPQPFCNSKAEVDVNLQKHQSTITSSGVLNIHARLDGSINDVTIRSQTLRQLALMLILNKPFDQDSKLSTSSLKISDAAVLFGFNYAPAGPQLRLVAGEWSIHGLAEETDDPSTRVMLHLLESFERVEPTTFRSRTFELLTAGCFRVRCELAATSNAATISKVFPHFKGTAVENVSPRRNMSIVVIPKVTSTNKKVLFQKSKEKLIETHSFTGIPTLNPNYLPWLLTDWLKDDEIAIPATGQSDSQDAFIRLPGNHILGLAFKAAKTDPGSGWLQLQEEIDKAPKLLCNKEESSFTYTLVLYSLHLHEDLRAVVGERDSIVLGAGKWYYDESELIIKQHGKSEVKKEDQNVKKEDKVKKGAKVKEAKKVLVVPLGMEVVIVNPSSVADGGLVSLFGSSALKKMKDTVNGSTSHEEWLKIVGHVGS